MPDASISADAIVGFPNETEEQFENTLALVADIADLLNTAAIRRVREHPRLCGQNQLVSSEERSLATPQLVSIKAESAIAILVA